jgi:hypothetical protein
MKPYLIKELHGGTQKLYKFDNGFGASVINNAYSYGQELAVIKWDDDVFDLTYETPITDDVIGYISDEELIKVLDKIKNLYTE